MTFRRLPGDARPGEHNPWPLWPANPDILGYGSVLALAASGAVLLSMQRRASARVLEVPPPAAPAGPNGDELTVERYDLLVNYTRDIIYFIDDHNRIVEANAAAARSYGYSPKEMLGLDVAALQSRETRAAAKAALERARSRETVVIDTEHRRKNGTEFPVEVTLTARRGRGGESEVLAVVRDSTERHAADDSLTAAYDGAVEASRLKSQFVAAMGHEVRTPMNAIIGMSELMLDTELTTEQRAFSEAVRQSGKSLLRIFDDVLDYSQIQSGGPDLELGDVDCAILVESTVAAFEPQANAAGLMLTTRLDPEIKGLIRADGARLRQIISYLIDNAVKFTKKGSIVVSAALETQDEWSMTVRFAVEDSGPGIEPDVASVIFEPFRQADRSAARQHTGAGLGLPIASRLVELMGGTLLLESVPDVGSTFWFSANFERAEPDDETVSSSIIGARSIVVDDDPMSREIVHRLALSWGIENSVASGGKEALEILRERARAGAPCDVAIVDYTMPGGMGGIELGLRIKADPELANTELILITAYKDLQQRQAAGAAGFSSYLTKPVDRTELFESVTKAIHRARVRVPDGARSSAPTLAIPPDRAARILLAEDHPINQRLALQQLKRLGFDAVAVANGEQVLAELAAAPYDLLFMDCQMPKMDGFAATRAIREREAQSGQHVTIVAMTADALLQDRRKCLSAGMDDFLPKPVQLEDLQKMIQRWVWDPAVAV